MTALQEFRGSALLTVGNVSDLSNHRSMLKRAELVLKYLIKSIDAMKQMQDSVMPHSMQETLRNEEKATHSILLFPEDVIDLPCDPTNSVQQCTTLLLGNSTRIGRLPKRKIQHSNVFNQETEKDLSEMSRFIDTTQPWRTRTTSILTSEESLNETEPLPVDLSSQSESFDLTSTFYFFVFPSGPKKSKYIFSYFRSFGGAVNFRKNYDFYSI